MAKTPHKVNAIPAKIKASVEGPRFGYLEWTQKYRLNNTFYKLPDLKVGDEIDITWDQHRYKYKVTKLEEGKEITDYSTDLILYTCKFLVSPVRIMVYANLIR